jgi:hypothetical protein
MRIVARLLTVLPLLWVGGVWADVCSGPIILETQAQIDTFGTSACAVIDGDLTVSTFESGNDIVNLDGLANITSVRGYLRFWLEGNTVLTNLDGLSNLTSVGRVLTIFQTELTNLNGLSKLSSTGGLEIQMCESLTNADGLANLGSVNGDLNIGPTALKDLDMLANLVSVAGMLKLQDNFALTDVDGLANITSVGGDLSVVQNESLANCRGIAPVLGWPDGPPNDGVGGEIQIGKRNGTGCNSVEEVIASVASATPVPTLPLYGFGILVSLLGLFGLRKLRQ